MLSESEDIKDRKEYKKRQKEAITQLNAKLALHEPHVRHIINSVIDTKRKSSQVSNYKLGEALKEDSFGTDDDAD